MLTAMTVLSTAAAPAISDYVEDAKLVRAAHDTRTIGVSLVRLFSDVGQAFDTKHRWGNYDLLVGNGGIPVVLPDGSREWATPVGGAVGLLDDQLTSNAAGYPRMAGGFVRGWRGAYLESSVHSDPWGQRYAVNVKAMHSAGADTVVISAGPDGVVQSQFLADGLPTAGDDILALVSSTGIAR